jgi:hypothetical protein
VTESIFGSPTDFDGHDELDQWIRALETLWRAFSGKSVSDLDEDLQALSALYGKQADARRLKEVAARAAAVAPPLPPEVAMPVLDGVLITPAGRVLLDELLRARSRGLAHITQDRQTAAANRVAAAFQRWYHEWAEANLDGRLSPPVLAFACFLLLANCIGEERALRLPADEHEDRQLLAAVVPVINAGSIAMGGKRLGKATSLRSSWVISQATRFLVPYGLHRRARGGRGSDAHVWVASAQRERYVSAVGRRIAARGIPPSALSVLRDAYETQRPHLLALGVARDDPLTVRASMTELREAMRNAELPS